MCQDIDTKLEAKRQLFIQLRRHTIVENYMEYIDELAEMIGVKPNLFDYIIQDPRLASRLIFGPFLPYQFRLRGPKPWSGAREAINSVWDRVWFPTKKHVETGTADSGDKCSCPMDTGCLIQCSQTQAFLFFSFALLLLLVTLIKIF